ncbi:T9SS type A sorting domain-containing protein [Frigoriflavimonas asaccharolytica]|uniref:Secretion system C-terminal sorting domain-containing protein n=1 Tax=Frigoriflavimonas asaccharolytica TaxID=2735899 RepID=A0A8J8K933_9FLAO|nr:T9SS type A sorting domain-containing protein [Frigoriflavimonas asaccharolytica]NRS92627.1 hypothetical protein [Frigoriflavimonas asaccharolytica]
MKTKLLFIAAYAFATSAAFGQTTLFSDNFDKAGLPDPPASPSQNQGFSGAAGTTSTAISAVATYTGVNTSLWKLDSGNGTSGLNAIYTAGNSSYTTNLSLQGTSSVTAGAATRATATVAVPVPFSGVLSSNAEKLTWSFALRTNRSSQLPQLTTAFTPALTAASSTATSIGFIVATNLAAGGDITTTGSGYAIIYSGGSGTTNAYTFGSFTGGLNSQASFTPLLSVDNITASTNGCSIILSYTPSTNTWEMNVRQDLVTSLPDPQSSTANAYIASTPASVVNTTYTNLATTNMMLYYNYSGTNGIYLDNLKVTSGSTTVPSVLGVSDVKNASVLSIYPNPAREYFILESKKSINEIAIYNAEGRIVKSISNPKSNRVDISSLEKGYYVVKILSDKTESSKKLIVE